MEAPAPPPPPRWYGPMRATLVDVGDLPVNEPDNPTPFENEHFVGEILVRVKGAKGAPEDVYFEGWARWRAHHSSPQPLISGARRQEASLFNTHLWLL